jgi:hypothetical protein
MTPKSPTSNASFVHNVNVLVNGIISCNKELKALLVPQLESDSISWEEKQIIKLQIAEDKNDALRKPLEGMPLHDLNEMHRKLCIFGSASSTRKCSGPKKKVPQAPVKKRIMHSRVAQQTQTQTHRHRQTDRQTDRQTQKAHLSDPAHDAHQGARTPIKKSWFLSNGKGGLCVWCFVPLIDAAITDLSHCH